MTTEAEMRDEEATTPGTWVGGPESLGRQEGAPPEPAEGGGPADTPRSTREFTSVPLKPSALPYLSQQTQETNTTTCAKRKTFCA